MLKSLLIANRGEIARRIIRTARRMGIRTVAVVTEADRSWPHWREADDAIAIGEGPAAESYLSIDRIIAAARSSGAEAVHPGYGFLSENADFAEACEAAGLIFVGPPAQAMRAMGSKAEAKAIMTRAGVPVVPGYGGERQEPEFLRQKAYEIGYPILVKAVAGGGGRGMRRVDRALDFDDALAGARREALSAFGDGRVLIERYVERPRHIEVQVFADAHGSAVHLFERDCSVQRRHQKVIEEAPAPGISEDMRQAICQAAVKAALAVAYRGAGTVEFIADASDGMRGDRFFFIEMNTRLQVEHPVTEAVTGLDLVEWQLRIAAGEPLPLGQDGIALRGHAVEARLYAEDPGNGFRPSTGRIRTISFPSAPGLRVDSGVEEGSSIGSFYDAMLAKVIASGRDRKEAVARLGDALGRVRVAGPKTNLAFLSAVLAHPDFRDAGVDTGFVDRHLDALVGLPLERSLAAPAIAEWTEREALRLAERATGPWARTDAFEVGGLDRLLPLAVEIDGEDCRAVVRMEDGLATIAAIGGDAIGKGEGGEVVWAEREAIVLKDGRQIRIAFPDPLDRDSGAVRGTGDVAAPMPGRVIAVMAALGDAVTKGDPLFAIEAMKMEHTILAPLAGTVTEVRVTAGDQIEQGAAAILIEAAAPERPEPVD